MERETYGVLETDRVTQTERHKDIHRQMKDQRPIARRL